MNTDQLIAKLDELIAATRSAAIPANMRWLSAESMAAMLDMSPRQFAERLACKPGFPNPRAWIVTKQGMTGDLYDALAWDNGGKPLGVSVNTPIPLYEAQPQISALQEQLDAFSELLLSHRDAMARVLEAWDTTTNSRGHDGRLWQCMEELRMEIEK